MTQIAQEHEPLAAISILNPSYNNYRFLFRAYYTEQNIADARSWIHGWLAEHEMDMRREKHKKIEGKGMFEVIVWLN